MAKYKVLFSDKVHIEEEIEAKNEKEAIKKAEKEFYNAEVTGDDGRWEKRYEVNEWEAELLPREKYYFEIESVELAED